MNDIVYVLDDHFDISEKVENMSEEELDRRIASNFGKESYR